MFMYRLSVFFRESVTHSRTSGPTDGERDTERERELYGELFRRHKRKQQKQKKKKKQSKRTNENRKNTETNSPLLSIYVYDSMTCVENLSVDSSRGTFLCYLVGGTSHGHGF